MAGATEQLVIAVHSLLTALLTPASGWSIHKGKLHASVGGDSSVGWAGVAPFADEPRAANQQLLDPVVEAQVFLPWDKVVDNERVVDPQPIMDLAHAFRARVELVQNHNTELLWYFNVQRLWYPDDPTGQKTRFHALLRGVGTNNASLLESGP